MSCISESVVIGQVNGTPTSIIKGYSAMLSATQVGRMCEEIWRNSNKGDCLKIGNLPFVTMRYGKIITPKSRKTRYGYIRMISPYPTLLWFPNEKFGVYKETYGSATGSRYRWKNRKPHNAILAKILLSVDAQLLAECSC